MPRYAFKSLALRILVAVAGVSSLLERDLALLSAADKPLPAHKPMLVSAEKQSRALAGIAVVEGVRMTQAATAPTVVGPVAMTFDRRGNAFVVERHQTKNLERIEATITFQDGTPSQSPQWSNGSPDAFKQLVDADGDGIFEASTTLMADLSLISSIAIHDGWTYFAVPNRIVRRRLSANDGSAEPINIQTTERRTSKVPLGREDVIEQDVLKGISGFDPQLLTGLTVSPDGWLYVSLGAGDHRLEGANGSRSVALRSGAIVRCRPDGSELHEVARGLRSPAGAAAFDPYFNLFQVDGDPEVKAGLAGTRLLHVLEGDDFGWRLAQGATSVTSDAARSTLLGDRPGTTAAVALQDAGIPRGATFMWGSHLPPWLAGAIVYADPSRQRVVATRVERKGSSFRAAESFDLVAAQGDAEFRPSSVTYGPDGTLYVLDARRVFGVEAPAETTSSHGRIYRLAFSDKPATPQDSVTTVVSKPVKSTDVMALSQRGAEPPRQQLIEEFATQLRRDLRSVRDVTELAKIVKLDGRSDIEQATFFAAICQGRYDSSAQMLIVEYATRESDIGHIAADLFVRNATLDSSLSNADTQIARLKFGIKSASSENRRSSAAALSKIGQLYRQRDAEQIRQLTTVLTTALLQERGSDPRLKHGLVHAVERLGEPAIRQLSTGITQSRSPNVDTAISAFEAMHSRPAARILDAIFFSNTSHLSAAQQGRLVRTYRHIQVDPPISLATLMAFLTADPDLEESVRLDGLETLVACVTDANRDELTEAIELLKASLKQSKRPETQARLERLFSVR